MFALAMNPREIAMQQMVFRIFQMDKYHALLCKEERPRKHSDSPLERFGPVFYVRLESVAMSI